MNTMLVHSKQRLWFFRIIRRRMNKNVISKIYQLINILFPFSWENQLTCRWPVLCPRRGRFTLNSQTNSSYVSASTLIIKAWNISSKCFSFTKMHQGRRMWNNEMVTMESRSGHHDLYLIIVQMDAVCSSQPWLSAACFNIWPQSQTLLKASLKSLPLRQFIKCTNVPTGEVHLVWDKEIAFDLGILTSWVI